MKPADKTTRFAFLTLLAATVLVAALPTVFPSIDLAASHYFLKPDAPLQTAKWWWVECINEHTPLVFRSLAVVSLLGWWLAGYSAKFRHWARPLAFVGIALVVGPGLAVSALKEITTRARPFHVTEFKGAKQFTPAFTVANQCDDNCAFVSGHTADGIFLASLMLIDRRRRWWWLAAGLAGGLAIGFARVSVGAHWLSDALWAFPVTLLASWLVYLAFERFFPVEPAPLRQEQLT